MSTRWNAKKKQLPADNTDWNWAFLELAALGLQNAAAGRIDDGESHRTSAPPCQPRKKKEKYGII